MANYSYSGAGPAASRSAGTAVTRFGSAAGRLFGGRSERTESAGQAEQKQNPALNKVLSFSVEFGPSGKDILNFTSQLAVMIKAGISIRAALESISEQTEKVKFRRMLMQIRQDVEAGKCFSEALARFPKTFSPLYINMVRASEMSGAFAEMLGRIADYQGQQLETRAQVRGAMIYPIIIGFMAVATTVFLLTFVLPRFLVIFAGKEAMLPAPTKAILVISYVMRTYWYLLLAGVIAVVWGFWWALSTPWGRDTWDKIKLRLPIFRKLCRCLYISRSLHTMGELVNAGVPMLDTIGITADISGNTVYRRMWRRVARAVEQGKKISEPLATCALLPRSVVQMISGGEESGKLSAVLTDVSAYYQKELKHAIRTVTAMIEPVMIVLMGAVVGFIAMSIILPIFKLSSLVKG